MCRRPWAAVPTDPDPAGAAGLQSAQAPDFWALKPPWCQPWTIVATGLVLVSASWLLLHRWWITLPVLLVVLGWWGLFLVLVPASWRLDLEARQAELSGPPNPSAPQR